MLKREAQPLSPVIECYCRCWSLSHYGMVKNMRILLVNPPYPFEESPSPPFGPMSLAAFLLKQGLEVQIEDYVVQPYSIQRVQQVAETFRPDIVGSTAVTMNINSALGILGDFRDALPGVKTVLGAPHVTFDAQNTLRDNRHVDFIVRGEAEITLMELINILR